MDNKPHKFSEIKKFIVSHILENNLKPGDKIPTIRFFAEKLHTSTLTVHRAIASLVSEGMLDSMIGSGTYVAETNKIGIIFPLNDGLSQNSYLSEILRGLDDAVKEKDFFPVFFKFPDTDEKKVSFMEDIRKLNLRGLLVYATSEWQEKNWDMIKALNISSVCVNNFPDSSAFSGVSLNNRKAGNIAAEHFIECGHQNFALVGNSSDTSSVKERISGFKESINKIDMVLNKSHIFVNQILLPDDYDRIADKISTFPKPLAVFAINDSIAYELIRRFFKMGIRLPDEVSIIGVDNQDFGSKIIPSLSSIKQPAYQMGVKAVKMLMEKIEHPEISGDVSRILLEPELITRESVCNLKILKRTAEQKTL